MPDVRLRSGAVPLCLRTLALGGVLLAALAVSAPGARAQAPTDASLCPPPPRRLTFAISAASARKPVRRKPAAARPRVAGAAAVTRRVRPVAKPSAVLEAVAVRPKKRAARSRSIVPLPRPAAPAGVANATAVCKPWTHELAAPLVGMVASAATPPGQLPLVGAVGWPFPAPVVDDDSSSAGGFWWMIPAGGIAIAGAATGGGSGESGGVAGVEVGRGASGTPVVGRPVDVEPVSVGAPDAPRPGTGSVPGAEAGAPEATQGGTSFAPLPPVPPVGSTTPRDASPFAPPGSTSAFTPEPGPAGTPPEASVPGGTPPGGGPGRPGTDEPGLLTPPTVGTAVVPEPSPLSLVLVGGGLLSLVAWGAARRS